LFTAQNHRAAGPPRRPVFATKSARLAWYDAVVSLVVISSMVMFLEWINYVHRSPQPVLAIAVLWSAFVVALWSSDVYSRSRTETRRTVRRIGKVSVVTASVILVAEALIGAPIRDRVPPVTVLLALMASAASIVAYRILAARRRRNTEAKAERVLVLGTGVVAKDVVSRLERSGGSAVLGFVDDETSDGPVVGSIRQLPELCRSLRVSRVIVAFPTTDPEQLLSLLRALPSSVAVDFVPKYFELMGWGTKIEDFDGLSLVSLRQRCDPAKRDRVKRAFDLVIAPLGLILVSPIVLVAALVILCTDGRPVFFRQERMGRGRRPFRIVKLRTLKTTPDTDSAQSTQPRPRLHSELVAGRTTGVGKFLRRTGVDELPQLFNVLAGHMSLVGPRPFIPEECGALSGLAERRFDVCPGLTGLWQVSGQHDLSLEDLVRLDTYYVDTWTFWSDLRILAMTPSRLTRGGGDGAAKPAVTPVLEPTVLEPAVLEPALLEPSAS
jgi:exopolysaccharide biosynthesis polyprenyl glycosylphosphotransferase